MKNLVLMSVASPAGKTAVAAGIGCMLAQAGASVRLVRLRSEERQDAQAEGDARALAAVPGCSSSRRALGLAEAVAEAEKGVGAKGLAVVESPEADPETVRRLSAGGLLCGAGGSETQLAELQELAGALGDAVLGVVVTAVPRLLLSGVASALAEAGLPRLAVLPEDRLLAAPAISEMASVLDAGDLLRDGRQEEAVEYLMIGPIGADPGMPYFSQHERKAVIARSEKTDVLLAALGTEPECLILTGGCSPSPYVLDWIRNSRRAVSVLLTSYDTVAAVRLLDDLYGRTRFVGQRKLERMVQLLREQVDAAALLTRLA